MEQLYQEISDLIQGLTRPGYELPQVKCAFLPGSPCDHAYWEMMNAYTRLRSRLGMEAEDPDVEIIVSCLADMRNILCILMFDCGMKYERMTRRGKLP